MALCIMSKCGGGWGGLGGYWSVRTDIMALCIMSKCGGNGWGRRKGGEVFREGGRSDIPKNVGVMLEGFD